MANSYGTPVSFTKENNVWILHARIVFGASGTPALDTVNSKGICNFAADTVTFTGGTTNSSTSLGSVSSFADLFQGMTITGPAGELGASSTISSVSNAGDSLVLSKQAIVTNTAGTYFATGGRFRVQFGTQAGVRVNPYVKLLGFTHSWDESTGSASGSLTQLQLAPYAPNVFIVDNNISTKTIPQTATSGSTDASIGLQMGSGVGGLFVAANPQPGEVLRLTFFLGNSYNT